jgi:hypothetical protein
MMHGLAGRGRRNVRDEDDVLDVVTITHQPANVTFFLQEVRLLRVQYGILCLTIRNNQCKVCSGGQTFPPTVLSMSAMQDYEHLSISVPWRGMKGNVYGTEVRICEDLINGIRFSAAVVHGQL